MKLHCNLSGPDLIKSLEKRLNYKLVNKEGSHIALRITHMKEGGFIIEITGKGIKMRTIKIKGMSCNHCVMAVTKALNEIEGIRDVRVDLEKGEATFDEIKPVDMEIISDKIERVGYEVGE